MKILIDNGHGVETPGKRSPDGRFREYAWTREIARRLVQELVQIGYDASLLVPEDADIPLRVRVMRANTECVLYGQRNVLLISIHVNAAGRGDRWYDASGWCCYTSKGQTEGDHLADCLYAAAEDNLAGHRLRKDYSDGYPDHEENFYILRHTLCPAVLSENGFQDNEESLRFLESEEGKQAIINLHIDGIYRFLSNY